MNREAARKDSWAQVTTVRLVGTTQLLQDQDPLPLEHG